MMPSFQISSTISLSACSHLSSSHYVIYHLSNEHNFLHKLTDLRCSLNSFSHWIKNVSSKNVLWDIIHQFNIFCDSNDFMDKVFKPQRNDLLGLLWHGADLGLPPKLQSTLPWDFSAGSTSVFLRLYFCFEVIFFPLLTQLMRLPIKCQYNTISRDNIKATSHHNHRLCLKWSPLWSLRTLYIHTNVLITNACNYMCLSPDYAE